MSSRNFLVVYGLLLASLAVSTPSYAQSIADTQALCKETLGSIRADDPAFARLENIYRSKLRFGLAPHGVLPRFYAEHRDVIAIREMLTDRDIPYIVFRLANVKRANSVDRVAIGVLTQFGYAALPCIEAATERHGAAGVVVLNQIKAGIIAKLISAPPG